MTVVYRDLVDQLDRQNPTNKAAELGTLLEAFITSVNAANGPTIGWNEVVESFNFVIPSLNDATTDLASKCNALIAKSNAIGNFLTSSDCRCSAAFTSGTAYSLSSVVLDALSTGVEANSASTASPCSALTLDTPRTTFNAAAFALNTATTATIASILAASAKLNNIGEFMASAGTSNSATFASASWSNASGTVSTTAIATVNNTASSTGTAVTVATLNDARAVYNGAAYAIASATTAAAAVIAAQVTKANAIADYMAAAPGTEMSNISKSAHSNIAVIASAIGVATMAPSATTTTTVVADVPTTFATLASTGGIGG